jgi:hypothetical protein
MYVAIAKNTSMTGQRIAVGKYTYTITGPQLTKTRRCRIERCFLVSSESERKTMGIIRQGNTRKLSDRARWWPKLLHNCRVENISSSLSKPPVDGLGNGIGRIGYGSPNRDTRIIIVPVPNHV